MNVNCYSKVNVFIGSSFLYRILSFSECRTSKNCLYVLPDVTPFEKDISRRPLCPVCMKYFYDITTLRRHMEIHEPQRQKYVCNFCNKSFCWKNHLQSHVRKFHNPKPPLQWIWIIVYFTELFVKTFWSFKYFIKFLYFLESFKTTFQNNVFCIIFLIV